MQRTGIEYLDMAWNPIAMRCTPVSAGCANCWHLRMAKRHAANATTLPTDIMMARAGGPPVLLDRELDAPLRRRKPVVIGVQFMGDLFHESLFLDGVPSESLTAVMCAAANTFNRRHTFVFLTKRPGAMRAFLEGVAAHLPPEAEHPPPNWWLGVSVEDQQTADERIPILLDTPAAVRWVSYEPALGPVDARQWLGSWASAYDDGIETKAGVDWVVAGAETGPRARPVDTQWFRDVRDQCVLAGVPFFFKVDRDGNHRLGGVVHEAMPG